MSLQKVYRIEDCRTDEQCRREAELSGNCDRSQTLHNLRLNALFELTAENGSPVPLQVRPLVIALQKHQAAHRAFWLQNPDGSRRRIEATAFPLEGQGARHLGAVVILWEADPA